MTIGIRQEGQRCQLCAREVEAVRDVTIPAEAFPFRGAFMVSAWVCRSCEGALLRGDRFHLTFRPGRSSPSLSWESGSPAG